MYSKFREACISVVFEISERTDRQTDTLIAILRTAPGEADAEVICCAAAVCRMTSLRDGETSLQWFITVALILLSTTDGYIVHYGQCPVELV